MAVAAPSDPTTGRRQGTMLKSPIIFVLILLLAACSGGSGGGGGSSDSGRSAGNSQSPATPSPPEQPGTPDPDFESTTISLSWSIPTQRENGEPLLSADIAGYELYYFRDDESSANCCTEVIYGALNNSITLTINQAGDYYFAVSAFDRNAVYSDMSAPVSASF